MIICKEDEILLKHIVSRNKFRFLMIISTSLLWIVIYLMRVNIGALLVDVNFLQDLGLQGKNAQQGLLMTVFLIVYSLANMVAIPVSNRLGPRRAILLGVLIAALAMMAGGWAASFAAILTVRVLLGVGNGIHFPNMSILVKRWFPPHERGLANSLYGVGGCIGMVIAFPLFSSINTRLGWEYSFIIPGLLALLVTLPLWLRWISDSPQDNPYISAAEAAYIHSYNQESGGDSDESEPSGLKYLLGNGSFWLLCLAYTAFLSSWWGLLTWMPQYLVEARHFDLQGTASNVTLAYIVSTIGILTGGRLVDRSSRRSRIAAMSLLVVAFATLGVAIVPSAFWAVIFMIVAVGINEFVYPAVWSLLQSLLTDRMMAAGSGTMSGVSNLLSALSPLAIGWLIQISGSYVLGLLFLVSMSALGAVSCMLLYRKGY
ncbi:MAG: MFS transporter [Syntrophomonadaceae bacterium]|nr:MFS transporter [Syntrophomonadaceae bacterium]